MTGIKGRVINVSNRLPILIRKHAGGARVERSSGGLATALEAGWSDVGDPIVFVDVPRPLRLERLQAARGWDDAELAARERNQLPLEEKRRRADAVIDNRGPPEAMADQVTRWLRTWNLAP